MLTVPENLANVGKTTGKAGGLGSFKRMATADLPELCVGSPSALTPVDGPGGSGTDSA